MPFVTVRDLNMYYEIRGTGPRLFIINGSGGDLRRPPSIFAIPLAKSFQILAYDQRGLGQTSKPDKPYSMADYAEDAIGLLDALGWEECRVIGISFGGMVAQELASRHPQRVERLVLCCSSSGGAGGSSYPLHELSNLPAEERVRRSIQIMDKRRDAVWQASNPEQYKALFDQMAGLRAGASDPESQMGMRRQLEARANHDTYDRLPSLRMPVFLCGGRYDGQAPPANLKAMKQQIPGARLEFFEGGHPFLTQDPSAFKQIEAFLLEELKNTRNSSAK